MDSYNAFLALGSELPVTAGDLTEMDVIGYDPVTAEPTSQALCGFGIAGLLGVWWRLRGCIGKCRRM